MKQEEFKLERRVPFPEEQGNRPMATLKHEISYNDLEALVSIAKKAGPEIAKKGNYEVTSDAKIITTDQVIIDERVRMKCQIPMCFGYNSSAHCPPHSPTAEQMRLIVGKYQYAIFLRYSPKTFSTYVYPNFLVDCPKETNDLNHFVSIIESEAQYMGYALAMGFKGGPCCLCGILGDEYEKMFMDGKPMVRCPVIAHPGSICNQYLRSRPALEACSVDVFSTAKQLGWESVLPLPEHTENEIRCISWYGMVLVG